MIKFGLQKNTNYMRAITLLSDWGLSDYYLAMVKARLYSYLSKLQISSAQNIFNDIQIVDISHTINKFDIVQGAYVLKNAYPYFEEGSIHIIGMNNIASIEKPHVIVKNEGHYFIGAYSNFFTMLFDSPPEEVWEINLLQDSDVHTFPSRDLFPKVAYMLLKGEPIKNIAIELSINKDAYLIRNNIPITKLEYSKESILVGASIKGSVIHIDSYGNVVTNITASVFKEYYSKFNSFIIKPRIVSLTKGETINSINTAYDAVEEGELCAIFLDNQYLELSINRDNISQLMGLSISSIISVIFLNPK